MNDQPLKTYWPVGLLACFPSLKTRQTPAHLQLLWKTVTQAPIFGRIATPAQGMPAPGTLNQCQDGVKNLPNVLTG